MKYKVGDKVRVKSLEWYINNYDICGTIIIGNHIFTTSMLKHCESIVTIDSVCVDHYLIKEDEGLNGWTDDMFEGLAEEGIYDEEFKNAINAAYNACLDDEDNIDPFHELCQSKLSAVIIDSDVFKDEVELILNGYEIMARGDKTYAVKKKPKYPTTYEECCSVLGMTFDYPNIGMVSSKECCLYSRFIRLIRCRDAYWDIADNWEPDWNDNYQKKWIINFYQDKINLTNGTNVHFVLVFPTEEMRNAFYENFKDLIEKCKELL